MFKYEERLLRECVPGDGIVIDEELVGMRYGGPATDMPPVGYLTSVAPNGSTLIPGIMTFNPKTERMASFGSMARFPGVDFKVKVLTGKTAKRIRDAVRAGFLSGTMPVSGYYMDIGGDPEVFVVDGKDKVIPSWKFLGEKEKQANVISDQLRDCKVYWDGFQAELAPVGRGCIAYYSDTVQAGLVKIWDLAKKYDKTAKLSFKPVVEVDAETLKSAEQKFVDLACMPSVNVYGDAGIPVADVRELGQRFAGGHIHFGVSMTPEQLKKVVRSLDGVLGVCGVLIAQGLDDPYRRMYYGRAGEHRLPKHGLEYRTLSNYWLAHPAMLHLTYEIARMAVKFGYSGLYASCWEAEEQEVRDIINTCDIASAKKLFARNQKAFEMLMAACPIGKAFVPAMVKVINQGMKAFLDVNDFKANWKPTNWTTHCCNNAMAFSGWSQNVK